MVVTNRNCLSLLLNVLMSLLHISLLLFSIFVKCRECDLYLSLALCLSFKSLSFHPYSFSPLTRPARLSTSVSPFFLFQTCSLLIFGLGIIIISNAIYKRLGFRLNRFIYSFLSTSLWFTSPDGFLTSV